MHNLQESPEDMEMLLLWFPAHIMLRSFSYRLRAQRSNEILEVEKEVRRLLHEKQRALKKYEERIAATLSFYLLLLIYHYENVDGNKGRAQEYERSLAQLKQPFYKLYKELRLFASYKKRKIGNDAISG